MQQILSPKSNRAWYVLVIGTYGSVLLFIMCSLWSVYLSVYMAHWIPCLMGKFPFYCFPFLVDTGVILLRLLCIRHCGFLSCAFAPCHILFSQPLLLSLPILFLHIPPLPFLCLDLSIFGKVSYKVGHDAVGVYVYYNDVLT